jgi:hypothetical protein
MLSERRWFRRSYRGAMDENIRRTCIAFSSAAGSALDGSEVVGIA